MVLSLTAKSGRRLYSTQPTIFRIFLYLFTALWLAVAILGESRAQATEIKLETRAKLQLTLKQYIDAGTVDGIYEHFDIEKGRVEKLRLKTLHPVIFRMESKFMMCADFLDADDKSVILDYIVGASANGYRIEQEIPGRRSYLQQFFERLD